MTLISGVALLRLAQGAAPIEILTGGATPPISINLRLGLPEAIFAFSVNLVALFGVAYVVREKYATAVALPADRHGHPGHGDDPRPVQPVRVSGDRLHRHLRAAQPDGHRRSALSATFKYFMATVLASGFFLVGTALLYAVTGLLNIDDLIANRAVHRRTDRLRRTNFGARLPAAGAEAVPGERLGPRCLRDGAQRCRCADRGRRFGRRVLCALEAAAAVREPAHD